MLNCIYTMRNKRTSKIKNKRMFLFYHYVMIMLLCDYVMIILFTCFSYDMNMNMTNGLSIRASRHSL